MWEAVIPWEEQWESLKVNESKVEEQEIDDDDRQVRFWRHRPDRFTVNEKERHHKFLDSLPRPSQSPCTGWVRVRCDLCCRIQKGDGHW